MSETRNNALSLDGLLAAAASRAQSAPASVPEADIASRLEAVLAFKPEAAPATEYEAAPASALEAKPEPKPASASEARPANLFAELGLSALFSEPSEGASAPAQDASRASGAAASKPAASGKKPEERGAALSLDSLLLSMTGAASAPEPQPDFKPLLAPEPQPAFGSQPASEPQPSSVSFDNAAGFDLESPTESPHSEGIADGWNEAEEEEEQPPAEEQKSVRSRFADIPAYHESIAEQPKPSERDSLDGREEDLLEETPPAFDEPVADVERAVEDDGDLGETLRDVETLQGAQDAPHTPEEQEAPSLTYDALDPEPEVVLAVAPEPEPAVAPAPAIAPVPAAVPSMKLERMPEPEPESDPEPEAESEFVIEPEPELEPKMEPAPEPDLELESRLDPELDPEPPVHADPVRRITAEEQDRRLKAPGRVSRTLGAVLVVAALLLGLAAASLAFGVVNPPDALVRYEDPAAAQPDVLEDKTGMQTYRYQVTGLDGETYDVVETALFGAAGYLENSEMLVSVPDEQAAQAVVRQMQEDFADLLVSCEATDTEARIIVAAPQEHIDKSTYDNLMAHAASE